MALIKQNPEASSNPVAPIISSKDRGTIASGSTTNDDTVVYMEARGID